MKILRPIASLVVLLASPVMTGCMHHGSVRSVTETDNGTTIALGRHDVLEVILPGNPSTGYSWQTVQLNSWVLAPLRRPVFTPPSASTGTNDTPRVGAGGSFRMTYEVVGAGTSPLELSYTRPWEPETNPNQTFKITVNVAK
ncbi:MAG: protease inhibitor I42 family protein [Verrucomicrobia bacterium]|nr:protease inhibitor I42 family protein [Verrucomicrobiota bacterium]